MYFRNMQQDLTQTERAQTLFFSKTNMADFTTERMLAENSIFQEENEDVALFEDDNSSMRSINNDEESNNSSDSDETSLGKELESDVKRSRQARRNRKGKKVSTTPGKRGVKAKWSDDCTDDLVDIICNNELYKRKLIFTNTKTAKNGE